MRVLHVIEEITVAGMHRLSLVDNEDGTIMLALARFYDDGSQGVSTFIEMEREEFWNMVEKTYPRY